MAEREWPEQRAEDVGFWAQVGARGRGQGKRRWTRSARTRRVQLRYTDAEFAEVQALAARLGMTPGAWLASLGLAYARGQLAPIPADWQRVLGEVMRAQSQLAQVGRLLNQVAGYAHRHGHRPDDADRILALVDEAVRPLHDLEFATVDRISHDHRR